MVNVHRKDDQGRVVLDGQAGHVKRDWSELEGERVVVVSNSGTGRWGRIMRDGSRWVAKLGVSRVPGLWRWVNEEHPFLRASDEALWKMGVEYPS